MRTTEANQLQSLRAVQSFLDQHRHRLPDIATGGARRRLDESLTSLELHVADQAGSELGARGHTQRYRALRRRLIRTQMAPIALIARAAEPPVPALEPFRLPRGKPTAQRLAAAAYGMAQSAEPHAETFTAAGLPDDFATRLVRAADAMLDAITAREKELARHRGATEGIRTRLASARQIVRVLDAFVRAECETDEALVAGWESAMHVRRTARRQMDAAPIAVTAPVMNLVTEFYGTADEPKERVIDVRRGARLGTRVLALFAGRDRARFVVGA